MKIDIDKLTEPELVDLNHRIVARLRFLAQMRALEFSKLVIGLPFNLRATDRSRAC